MTSVVRVTSVKRLKCVVLVMCVSLLARMFSLRVEKTEVVKSGPPVMKVYPLRSAVVVASVPFKPTVVHLTSVTFVKSVNWPSE